MRDYFIRRLLLIPPTLLGISIMVFAITRLAPGGPLEQAMMQMQQVSEEGGGGKEGKGERMGKRGRRGRESFLRGSCAIQNYYYTSTLLTRTPAVPVT